MTTRDAGSAPIEYRSVPPARGLSCAELTAGHPATRRTHARTITPWAAYGHSQQFRLRAQDAAGNWSEWQASTPLTVGLVEDTNRYMHYSTGWLQYSSTAASGGRYHYTTRVGATVSFTTTARQFAISDRVSPVGGSVYVYVNGVYQGKVSLYSSSGSYMHVLWSKDFGSSASRTITLKAAGTASRPRVYMDALLVGR